MYDWVLPKGTICEEEEVTTQPIPCETKTTGGNARGASCKFPFNYYGKDTYECITDNNDGILWCATTYDYTNDYIWGNCAGIDHQNYNYIYLN